MPGKEHTHNESIDAILERCAERRQANRDLFPPDFVHGSAKLQELYERFGDWAEDVTFLRTDFDGDRLVSASIAYFDDWFLTVEHAESSSEDLRGWIEDRTRARSSIVEIAPSGRAFHFDDCHRVVIAPSRERLRALEIQVLNVTRDTAHCENHARQTAQIDLLSLVCLCARLAA